MSTKARSTQRIVNAFPPWSSAREDEQSMAFQFLNVPGKYLDDLVQQQQDFERNRYLSEAIVADLDLYYSAALPGSFDFTREDNDELNPTYTTPIVSGEINGTNYPVAIASGNDIESWWYDYTPDRLETGIVASGEHIIASGISYTSPFSPIPTSGETHAANKLWVTVSGGTSFLDITEDNILRRGSVQIEGTTREGVDLQEELIFVYDDTISTKYDYASVDEVRSYGIEDDEDTLIKVESARFNHPHYQDDYLMDYGVEGVEAPILWSVEPGVEAGQYTLNLNTYNAVAIEERIAGFVDVSPIIRQELQDTAGNRIAARDMALEPNTNRVWVVDSTKAYIYDTLLPYPNTTPLIDKDFDAPAVIEPNKYYFVPGETAYLDYVWLRPVQGIEKHRVWVEDPTGTKYTILDGFFVTYTTGSTSWVYGEPTNRTIRYRDEFTLDLVGDYIFYMETAYADGTTSIDARILSVVVKQPLRQYDLSSLDHIDEVVGIDFDSEHKLWVLGSNGVKYQIDRHYDVMIIDFDRKVLYFKENYDKIRVVTDL